MREIEWEDVKANLDRLTDESLTDFLKIILGILRERHTKVVIIEDHRSGYSPLWESNP